MKKTPEQKSADAKRARLWLLYRITPEENIAIEKHQREIGMGILMGSSEESTGTDHDHTTGMIRGRLDFRINRSLGLLEAYAKSLPDGVTLADVIHALDAYMQQPPATYVLGMRYGLIGKAKVKKRMVYGSAFGPLPVVKKPRKKPKKDKGPTSAQIAGWVKDAGNSCRCDGGNTDCYVCRAERHLRELKEGRKQ